MPQWQRSILTARITGRILEEPNKRLASNRDQNALSFDPCFLLPGNCCVSLATDFFFGKGLFRFSYLVLKITLYLIVYATRAGPLFCCAAERGKNALAGIGGFLRPFCPYKKAGLRGPSAYNKNKSNHFAKIGKLMKPSFLLDSFQMQMICPLLFYGACGTNGDSY